MQVLRKDVLRGLRGNLQKGFWEGNHPKDVKWLPGNHLGVKLPLTCLSRHFSSWISFQRHNPLSRPESGSQGPGSLRTTWRRDPLSLEVQGVGRERRAVGPRSPYRLGQDLSMWHQENQVPGLRPPTSWRAPVPHIWGLRRPRREDSAAGTMGRWPDRGCPRTMALPETPQPDHSPSKSRKLWEGWVQVSYQIIKPKTCAWNERNGISLAHLHPETDGACLLLNFLSLTPPVQGPAWTFLGLNSPSAIHLVFDLGQSLNLSKP